MLRYIFILLFCYSYSSPAQDKEVGGVKVPSELTIKSEKLILNGAGVREKYFLDLYVCGLYLKTKNTDSKLIMNANEKMAIRIHITSGMVTNAKMQQAIREGFDKSTNKKTFFLNSRIEELIKAFSDPIKANDVFEIHYSAEGGSEIYKNGTKKTTIAGLDFKQALFGIWLGNNPAHESLRKKMLGLE